MTQLSYQQAVKLAHSQQQEIQRLTVANEQLTESIRALGKEARGSLLLNWYLVNKEGGEVRVDAKDLVGISDDSKFGYRYDNETDAYVFTAKIEPDEETVDAVYEPQPNAAAEGDEVPAPEVQ